MNKKKTRQQKGITLIALIITIVVLLILAVVAIRAVQGDGIINYAKNARDDYEEAKDVEELELQNYIDTLIAETTEYKEYKVGEEITINQEIFYVIEASSKTQSTVKLLAKYNIVVDKNSTDYLKQNAVAGAVAFSETNYWSSEFTSAPYDLKELNEYDIAAKYAFEYGKEKIGVTTGRLMTHAEANELIKSSIENTSITCWIGSAYSNSGVWILAEHLGIRELMQPPGYNGDFTFGVRPVIEISKDRI